jgi:putative oxidoreductase
MNAKQICGTLCGVSENYKNIDIALLIFRVVLGAAFIYHGWSKVSDMNGAMMMFSSMGVGTVVAYIASYVEFLGGVAILLGIMTRLAGFLLTIFMAVAIYMVHLDKGYSMMNGGYEYQLLLIAGVILVGVVGPGKFSLHENFCKNSK